MKSTKDIRQLIDDGKTELAIEQINHRLATAPTSDLHLLRIQLLQDAQADHIPTLRVSLDWLNEHTPNVLTQAREYLEAGIQARLAAIPGIDDDGDDDQLPVDVMKTVEALEPLADYLPVVYLARGLILAHQAQIQSRRRHRRSPLEILEELLAENENRGGDQRQQTPPDANQRELYQRARHYLEKAAQNLPVDDSRRGDALEILGNICEMLDNPPCAWKAYLEAQQYNRDFSEKLETLAEAVHNSARQRTLAHIDRLLQAGKLDSAETLLAACIPEDQQSAADFLVRKADLLFLRGEIDQAMALYSRLLEES